MFTSQKEDRVEYSHIVTRDEGAIGIIEMNWPERRNALSEDHLRELLHAFDRVADTKARGVILSGKGPVFSAGHDLSDMAGRDLMSTREILSVCSDLMLKIQSIPQVVIAQVEGLATAAGCQLVASCDLAVAGESAQFQVPGGKGGWFCTTPGVALGRAIGRKQAMEMLLTGDAIDAETALRWGLINQVVADGDVASATLALLARATRGSAVSRAIGKQAFYHQVSMDLESAYTYASEVMAAASQIPDGKENMQAFVEKRKPVFLE